MTRTSLLRSGLVLGSLAFTIASGCGDSSGGDGPSGTGGDGEGASAGDGDGDEATGGSGAGGNASGGEASGGDGSGGDTPAGGMGGVAGDGDGDGACTDRTGIPMIDGFLQAQEDMIASAASSETAFESAVASIESTLGLDSAGPLSARVDTIAASLSATVAANTAGGLWTYIDNTICVSDANEAQVAQVGCERAMCPGGGDVNPADVALECSGLCLGACDGSCSAESLALCADEVSAASCEGLCEGSCELTASACDGICDGTCTGSCSATDESGCIGECDGDCTGTCTPKEADECVGTCTGVCLEEDAGGGCAADVRCDPECLGECLGGCVGSLTPGAGLGECEYSAECQYQASALGLANLSCSPVTLRHWYDYNGPGGAEAAFDADMASIIADLDAAVEAFNLMSALIQGEANGEVILETSPVEDLAQRFMNVVQAGASGDLLNDATVAQQACALELMADGVVDLGDLAAESAAVLAAQASLVADTLQGFD